VAAKRPDPRWGAGGSTAAHAENQKKKIAISHAIEIDVRVSTTQMTQGFTASDAKVLHSHGREAIPAVYALLQTLLPISRVRDQR
jgi:hypothetical protein